MQSNHSYLTYIAREGCPGCTKFSSLILPSLLQSLPSNVSIVYVVQPQTSSMTTPLAGYSALSQSRPAIEFPMLAWSQQDPKIAKEFHFLRAEKMGSAKNIINWLDTLIPAAQAANMNSAAPSGSTGSVFSFGGKNSVFGNYY